MVWIQKGALAQSDRFSLPDCRKITHSTCLGTWVERGGAAGLESSADAQSEQLSCGQASAQPAITIAFRTPCRSYKQLDESSLPGQPGVVLWIWKPLH